MISKGYKKQLIVNAYNTQLLPEMDSVDMISIDTIKRTKNWLLFRIEDESIWLTYKCKNINIDYDIVWFLNYLVDPIVSISSNIKEILDYKFEIDEYKDYTKYLEDVHD